MTNPIVPQTPEVWKAIPDYEGLYEVSNLGNVKRIVNRCNIPRCKILKNGMKKKGYVQVKLYLGGMGKNYVVHRLVALAFLGIPDDPKMQVNHKNGIKDDNRVENLEWVTNAENARHSFDELGRKAACGEDHGYSKLTEAQVIEIRERYARGGIYQWQLANEYGVSQRLVSLITRRENWKHI